MAKPDVLEVLSVFDDFAEDYRIYIPQFHAQNRKRMKRKLTELADARARIAELIAADVEYDQIRSLYLSGEDGAYAAEMDDAEERRDAALAACRGL